MTLALTGSGRYIVSVNGIDLPGAHNFEREAIQRAANLELANPADVVEYRNELRVRVEAKATAPIPVPPPVIVPSADVLWRWNADTIAPFGIQAKDPSRVTLVTVNGRKYARLSTMPGDSNLYGSGDAERCDLSLSQELSGGYEGRDEWWEHEIVFPSDYVDPPPSPASANPWNWGLVANFHNTLPGAWQANFQVEAMPVTGSDAGRPTGLTFKMAWGTQATPTEKRYPAGPIVRNVPYMLRYHVRWSSGTDGFFDAWVNGVQKMDYKGPTLYPGQGVYLKLARYGSPTGKPCAVLHGPVVRGRTEASVT